MKQLNDSERSFVAQALVLAADKYVGFAVDCIDIAGGERLQAQWIRQATEIRYIAILFGDADSASLEGEGFSSGVYHGTLKEDSAKITNQQFAGTIRERLADGRR